MTQDFALLMQLFRRVPLLEELLKSTWAASKSFKGRSRKFSVSNRFCAMVIKGSRATPLQADRAATLVV